MVATVALLALGAVVVYAGAEAVVRGATTLARAFGLSAFVLGAMLFGIDLEGLGTALAAAGRGQTELAGGLVFGSTLFLLTAAFGLALLLAPRPIPSPSPTILAAPALAVAAAALAISDRFVSRIEGALLVALYAAFVFLVIREGRTVRGRGAELDAEAETPAGEAGPPPPQGPAEEPARPSRTRAALLLVSGVVVLYLGASLLVLGGGRLVGETALLAGFVGAALVGALTSLDTVLLEVLPARRGAAELATGNLFGTLGAFPTGVLGLAALVRPLSLDAGVNVAFLAMALVYAVVATTFFVRGRAGRGVGVFVLVAYAAWLLWGASL